MSEVNRKRNPLIKSYNDRVMDLFYRTKLREGEKVTDNRDSHIAKELGLTTQIVCVIITKNLNEKEAELSKRIEVTEDSVIREMEELEVKYTTVKSKP